MAPDSVFGSHDDDKAKPKNAPADPNEGVRVLKSDEVAEVAERAETAKRLRPDEKKYGDRPEAPPKDVKPAMRFPLAGSASPNDLERLRPAPVVAPTADDPTPGSDPAVESASAPDDRSDRDESLAPDDGFDVAPEAEFTGVEPGVGPDDHDSLASTTEHEPIRSAGVSEATAPADVLDPGDGATPDDRPVADEPAADEPSAPVLSVGLSSGETQLPHWTEPATGEVPRVIVGDDPGEDDDSRWAAFASSPRWRDEHTDWSREEDTGFEDLVADHDDAPLGALDESSRLMDEEYLTFDDLDVPDAGPPAASTRGTPADPIKIQRSGRPGPTDAERASERRSAAGQPRSRETRQARTPEPASASAGRDREKAVRVGVGMAVGALVIFLVGAIFKVQWLPLVLIVPAIVGCHGEFFGATTRAGFRPINLIGLIAGAALPIAAYFGGTAANPAGESGILLVVALTIAACMAWYLFGAGKGRPVANIAITLAAVLYIGVLGSYAALVLRAGPWPGSGTTIEQGIPLFLMVGIGTTMYDVAGYLLGSRIGRTPLSAASPNKTREGLFAGMVAALLSVVVLGAIGIGVRNVTQALVLGIVVAVVAPVGDLFESMIKRDLGVKDMSNLIPAHGGLLDRVDGYLFTLPAAFYTLRVLGLV